MTGLRFFAASAPGLEPLLEREVRAIGAREVAAVAGGVDFEGDAETMMRANLELGLASHVLVRIADLRARAFGELVRKVGAIPWEAWLDPDVPLRVRATARTSRLHHTGAIEERVRLGIAEALGAEPPAAATTDADAVAIHARFARDVCTISLDTSGAPLHRRGYRLDTGKAPLREDLARALVVVSGWDAETALFDPMCGSGTIPIEAALLARRIAPGVRRSFAFERTRLFDAALHARVRAEARTRERAHAPSVIWASDRDAAAAESARRNAERAGVAGDLRIAVAPLGRAPMLDDAPERGALVTNPPYGQRLGDASSLRRLYRALGEIARERLPGFRVAFAGSDRRLAHATGLPLRTAVLTDSGGLKLRFFVAEPAAHSNV